MANRRKSKNQKVDEEYSDLGEFGSQDFTPSQESQPSPNTQSEQHRKLVAALSELRRKEKAEREKKTKNEKKFLQVVVKHLDRDLTMPTSLIEETMKAVDVEYNAFFSKYSAQEDKIYKLWTELQNQQAKLVDIVNEKYRRQSRAITSTTSAHLTALSNMSSACKESRKLIDSLIPPSESDSDSDSDLNMTDGDN